MSDTFAEWQQEATPDEIVVRVCLNRRLYRQFMDAAAEIQAVKVSEESEGQSKVDGPSDSDLAAKIDRLADLEQQVRDAEKPMVFRAISPGERRTLEEAHRPTDEQRKADPKVVVNPDTYWPAAIAKCCVSPGLTVEQAAWLRDGDGQDWPGLPEGKWDEIVTAVSTANVEGSQVPKSVLSTARALKRGLSSITAADTESPSPSSEDAS